MGGDAFTHAVAHGHPRLVTPRMSNETYMTLQDLYKQKLLAYFGENFPEIKDVRSTIHVPGKETHGDVDFVVGKPVEDSIDFVKLAGAIGAAAVIVRGPKICSLAVPADGSAHEGPVVVYKLVPTKANKDAPDPGPCSPEVYHQVDVDFVPPDYVPWTIFFDAYGDLGGMIGNILKNLGLTINHRGLVLRFLALDKVRAKHPQLGVSQEESQFLLTNNPDEVMDFLGLDPQCFHKGFKAIDDLYSWLATCNLLNPDALYIGSRNHQDPQNASARRKRPVLRAFFKEYLPTHDPRFSRCSHSRPRNDSPTDPDETRPFTPEDTADTTDPALSPTVLKHRRTATEAALAYFHTLRPAYEIKESQAIHKMRMNIACELLKPIAANTTGRNSKGVTEIVRALRRFVTLREDGNMAVSELRVEEAESEVGGLLEEVEGKGWVLRNQVGVQAWVAQNWEEIRARERGEAKGGKGSRGWQCCGVGGER